IGGATRFGGGELDMHSRVFVHAPRKDGLLNLMNFPNRSELPSPEWVPGDAAACGTMNWDTRDLLPSIGLLFDRQTGKDGDFRAVLKALKEDPDGPKVDVQSEVVDRLTGRAYVV